MKRLVVVGGGISGLAAARAAVEAAAGAAVAVRVQLFERDRRVGGKASSLREDGWLVEAGPTAYSDGEPAMQRLVRAAGFEQELLPASPSAARRYLVRGGRMRRLDANPARFLSSGLLSPGGLLRLLLEPFLPRRRDGVDESVWQFAARRLGRETAERLVAPVVLGVFAGDARRLSLAAAFPRLAELEREHGSLVRGLLARRGRPGSGGPTGPAGRLVSFRRGMQSLVEALAERGGVEMHCGSPVERLVPAQGGGYAVGLADGELRPADAVVLAGEPWAMARLLRPLGPSLADLLDGIPCPPLAVVALGFGREGLERVPKGFGVLVPRGEGFRVLGCLWDTHLFDGRSPPGGMLVRAMLGGAVDPEVAALSEDELVRLVREDLAALLGLQSEPIFRRVVVWPRAIPQYELGHRERVAAIEEAAQRHPGLFLAGNALHGVSFAKAAAHGVATGERAVGWLLGRGGAPGCLARATRGG
jgi:oxygen-dependent protoporphyrinogen oxidase